MKKSSIYSYALFALLVSATVFTASCSKGPTVTPTPAPTKAHRLTSIRFTNTTFTPVTIYYIGSSETIPVNGQKTFSDSSGYHFSASAKTFGVVTAALAYNTTLTAGSRLGDEIDLQLSYTFPDSGILDVPLAVPSSEFFLRIKNVSNRYIGRVWVNYGLSGQEYFPALTIPNDSVYHNIGYFPSDVNSNVLMNAFPFAAGTWNIPFTLPFAQNQFMEVTATN